MSEASKSNTPAHPKRYGGKGHTLPDKIRLAIVADRMSGRSVADIANAYGVHRNTVSVICNATNDVPERAEFRERFAELPNLCVDAIIASVSDRKDVHRAAGTAQAHLKGIGVYGQDTSISITQLVSNLPESVTRLLDQVSTPQPVVSDSTITETE